MSHERHAAARTPRAMISVPPLAALLAAALALCAAPASALLLVIASDDPGVEVETVLQTPYPLDIDTARRVDTIDTDGVVQDWYGAWDGPLETYDRASPVHRARLETWAAQERKMKQFVGALRADGAFLTEVNGAVYASADPAVVMGAVSFWCSALPEEMRGEAAVRAAGLPILPDGALPARAEDWRERLEMPRLLPDGESDVDPFDRRDSLFALLMFMDRAAPGPRRLAPLDGLGGRQRLAVVCEALGRQPR